AAPARNTASANQAGQAHAARTLTPQEEAALVTRARSVVGPDFVWTNAEVFQAVERAMNLGEHPLRRQWVDAERTRRTPPPESHTLRNILIGAAVVVGVVVTAGALAEVGAGAAVVTGGATTTTAEVAAGTVFTETAAGVTGVRVVVDSAAVITGLVPLAEVEIGAAEAVAQLAWAL
ncbi:MAG TPA: hypothetical protein VN253_02740, partial [Kofleriaceae bacterium]|nr:hypothetical protein [Kofleriaceae bacterium]